jgi:hypothetical protein
MADAEIRIGREVVHAKWPDKKGIVLSISASGIARVMEHGTLLYPSGNGSCIEASVSSWRHVWGPKCDCHRVFEQDCPIKDQCVHRVPYDGPACPICENST